MPPEGRRFIAPQAGAGYAWWYLDAVSDDGRHALVVIAFLGYVFSPRFVRAQRHGAVPPCTHAALNAALYSPQRHRWALTEYPEGELLEGGAALRLGKNALRWDQGTLDIEVDEREAPVPRRLRARIEVRPGIASDLTWPLDEAGAHGWHPLAPQARVRVEVPGGPHWNGTGYLDCNRGAGALGDSFHGWSWLRAHGAARTTVVYETTAATRGAVPRRHLLRFSAGGDRVSIGAPPAAQPLARTRWGIERSVACDAGSTPRLLRTLEDTPFYARSLVETRLLGERMSAVHESLSLARFQSRWVQALLPFRSRRAR
ncbi:MAG: hypothetical protein JSS29_03280 [Proteobacteria bacterium]|nr:hypothetical protein [Pseudomonadota bacterium]